jgi:hypothetical protein
MAASFNGRKFKDAWKNKFPWVEQDPEGSQKAYCPFCQKLLSPKVTNLSDHEQSTKHIQCSQSELDQVWTIIQFHIFQRNVSTFKSFKIELFVCIS